MKTKSITLLSTMTHPLCGMLQATPYAMAAVDATLIATGDPVSGSLNH